MLSRFHRVPKRDGQTDGRMDGQTDIIDISISRVSVLTREKMLTYVKTRFTRPMFGHFSLTL